MYDSNVDPNSGEPAISNGVTFAIIPHGAGQALENHTRPPVDGQPRSKMAFDRRPRHLRVHQGRRHFRDVAVQPELLHAR